MYSSSELMDAGGQNTEMPVTDSSKTSVYGVNGVVSGGCKSHQTRFMIVIDLETLKQVSRHPAADSKANLHESSIKELGCPDCFHHFRLHFLASVVIQLLKYLYLIVKSLVPLELLAKFFQAEDPSKASPQRRDDASQVATMGTDWVG
eukprot:symbB.v1.2.004226.t1/scaffold221.1/size262466/10